MDVSTQDGTLKFSNDDWYEIVPYDPALLKWAEERGMEIVFVQKGN